MTISIFNYKEEPGYFKRLGAALKSTKKDIGSKIGGVLGKADITLSEEHLEDLESILIGADIGVQTALEVIDKVRLEASQHRIVTSFSLKRLIRAELLRILLDAEDEEEAEFDDLPRVILIVGVNGVGKTTTIGKLADRFKKEGKSVLVCAADTFRAAAVEQLAIWSEQTGFDLVRQKQGADPAAVLFDSIAACKARRREILLVDTAGRLHTKHNLMHELEKMRRISSREVEGAPHEVYLILDATTGQNGLAQAREFLKTAGVTGLVVTKLDGTAKGGIIVAIAKELKIPIRYIGVGEKADDLLPFSPEAFVETLLPAE